MYGDNLPQYMSKLYYYVPNMSYVQRCSNIIVAKYASYHVTRSTPPLPSKAGNVPQILVTPKMSDRKQAPTINWDAHNSYMTPGEQTFWLIYYSAWLFIVFLLYLLPSGPILCEISPRTRKHKWKNSNISRRQSV